MTTNPSSTFVPPFAGQSTSPTPQIDSRQLFQGGSALLIHHGGQQYVLRITRENKLILTK